MIGFSFTGTVAILLYVLGALVLVGSFISQQYKLLGWFRNRRSGDTPPQQPAPTRWWRPPLAADQRIVELIPTGGGSAVDFRAELANYGTQQCRCMITARVGDTEVECAPRVLDLIPNEPPKRVGISVPRPGLGDLLPEFNNETTLYGQTLHVEAVTPGGHQVSESWREHVYTPEENNVRYETQQRKWRIASGEETPADRRAERLSEVERRIESGEFSGSADRFEDV